MVSMSFGVSRALRALAIAGTSWHSTALRLSTPMPLLD